ncbi:hypothetical protein NDI45_04805 [Leptolyngbya sp. GB1-A1]|uniref:hypothetical protein n=1 Tax=Leptolyngbya sp. GB1-A1 TaxID=2933908 RepID=UPI0032977DEC
MVEIDGILFETMLPVQTIQVPQPGEYVPFYFGVHIINQSLISYRFNLPGFFPEIFNSSGQQVQASANSNARRRMTNQDIPLIDPGERATFWTTVGLSWVSQSCFRLSGYISYGAVWSTSNLELGTYHLQLAYRNHSPQYTTPLYTGTTYTTVEICDFWVGTVNTPLVKFCLVQS